MRELIQLYIGLCIMALVLKYSINALGKLRDKPMPGKTSHEKEHDRGHLIKLIILLLLAALLFFVVKRNTSHSSLAGL